MGVTELIDVLKNIEIDIIAHGQGGKSAHGYGQEIFIVHGHDHFIKQTVARFIENLGGKIIILHEKPNKGQTIIEKFEHYSNVGFAIVLMTADDEGKSNRSQAYLPRSRQNVILELGYFMAKLGRNRVCALYEKGVEIPSDILGVLYIEVDSEGMWKLKLAKELKAGGIEIDMNKIIDIT